MKPLSPGDPGYFTTYSTKPYDRHHYKIVFKNGKTMTVEDYESLRGLWYQFKDNVKNVEIIDPKAKKPKKTGGGGF